MIDRQRRSALDRVLDFLESLTRQLVDMREISEARLSAIENRLAAIDSGADAAASRRDALATTNLNRVIVGREMSGFKLEGPDAKLTWRKT
jgi:hypothetical protein